MLITLNCIEKSCPVNAVNYSSDTKLISIEFLLDNTNGNVNIDFSYLSGIGIKL